MLGLHHVLDARGGRPVTDYVRVSNWGGETVRRWVFGVPSVTFNIFMVEKLTAIPAVATSIVF